MKKAILYIFVAFVTVLAINQFVWISSTTIEKEKAEIKKRKSFSNSLTCILKAKKRIYKIGENPEFQIEIVNKTDSSFNLVGSLDGSGIGIRLPICMFFVKHQMFGKLDRRGFICGNVNSIREVEFKKVQPHNSFDPYQKIDDYGYFSSYNMSWEQFLVPGIYNVKFLYSTMNKNSYLNWSIEKDTSLTNWYFDNGKEEVYYGILNQERIIDSLWNLVPEIELESNEISIQYKI